MSNVDVPSHVRLELSFMASIAFTCLRCNTRNVRLAQQGELHTGLPNPPESPRGTRTAAIVPPSVVSCSSRRSRFRAFASTRLQP